VFQALRIECLAQNLPTQLDPLIRDFLEKNLKAQEHYLSSLKIKMSIAKQALNPDWFLNKGLAQCKISPASGALNWILKVPIGPKEATFNIYELQPIRFKYNDYLCSWTEKTLVVANSGNKLYRTDIENQLIEGAFKLKAYRETSDETDCLLSTIQDNWSGTKLACTLECSNIISSDAIQWKGQTIVSTTTSNINLTCSERQGSETPLLGAMILSVPCNCTLQVSSEEDQYTSEEC